VASSAPDPVAVLERIRELESELAAQWRKLGAVPPTAPEVLLQALEITVSDQCYLLPAELIREVVRIAEPQPLADAPDWVMGTLPYGSETVVLIDLAHRLDRSRTELSPDLFVIITDQPRWLGLVASGVGQVVEIDPGSLTTPGPEIPFALFLLGLHRGEDGEESYLLSVEKLGRELDG
jgi:chemotaxis signal transduction protein